MESSERTITGTVLLLQVRPEDSTHPTATPLSEVENAPPQRSTSNRLLRPSVQTSGCLRDAAKGRTSLGSN